MQADTAASQENPSFKVLVVNSGERTPDFIVASNAGGMSFMEAQDWVRSRMGGDNEVDYVFRLLSPTVAYWYRAGERNNNTGVLMGYGYINDVGLFTTLDDSSPIELPQPCKRPPPLSPAKSICSSTLAEPATKKSKRAPKKRIALDL